MTKTIKTTTRPINVYHYLCIPISEKLKNILEPYELKIAHKNSNFKIHKFKRPYRI
jgi:hypothetical protein